jgi:Xaa-Pro aminopeptidase
MAEQMIKTSLLSLQERNRRHKSVRAAMDGANLKALIVTGSNLLYLSNGIWGEMCGLFPLDEQEDFEVILPWRYLVDLDAKVVTDSQEWVKRVSSGRTVAPPLVERIKGLGLDRERVGFAGEMTQQTYAFLMKSMPDLQLVESSAILDNVRTIKSAEEVALIDRANDVFNAAITRICDVVRPGMTGRNAVEIGRQAMWEAGGDLDSTFTFNFGAVPAQNPLLANITLDNAIKDGDVATLTAHAHYHHYAGHSDQEIVFGTPRQRHVKMFDGVKKVRDDVLASVRAGITNRDLHNAYYAACEKVGFLSSEHSQMHQYGIDVPEFPGPDYKLSSPGKPLGGGGDFTLRSGMVFSISPTLADGETGELLLGGTSLVVTDAGFKELGVRPVELLVAG